ncbi:MAG: YDG domain-containing protein, partial [Pseudomonas amygdali]
GNAGGNYAVTLAAPTAGSIAAKALTLTAVADTKIYDGTTASAGLVQTLGLVSGDTVNASQIYDSKNAGNRTLQVANGYVVGDGNGGANYSVSFGNTAAGIIVAKTIAANATVNNKVYDATLLATGNVDGLTGIVAGDTVNIDTTNGVLMFTDRNAGNGKAIAATGYALNGTDAGNYTLAALANGVANITRAGLVLTAGTDARTYDGTTGSAGIVTAAGLRGADRLLSAAQAFDSRNAGDRGLQVVANSWTIEDGNAGGNYAVTLAEPTAGSIAAKALTLTAVADTKVYDGTTASAGAVQSLGLVSGDTVNASQIYDSKNAGNRTLQVANSYAIADGNGGANYVVSLGNTAAGTITAKTIAANATVGNKVYDATTAAIGRVDGLTGVVVGDAVGIDASNGVLAFADRNAGNGKAITATGYTLSGTDAGNYTLATFANGVANIARASLVLTAGTDARTYDGTTGSTGIVTAAGLVGTDRLLSATQAFDSRNAGDRGLQVVANSWTIEDGNAGGNYAVTLAAPTAGSIAAKALTLAAVADTKVYDGTTASAGAVQALGLVNGDTVNVSQVFDSRNAGNRVLQVANGYVVADGNGGANYVVSLGDAAVGAITAKTVAVDATVNDKVYDGTTTATGTVSGLTGLVQGDAVDVNIGNGVLAFFDKNAGNGKAVLVSGYTLNGTDAGNYILGTLASGVANIAKAGLVLTASSDAKTYDGTTASAGAVTITGLAGSDTATAVQSFDAKNAGNRNLTASSWTINDGNEGGNYAVTRVSADGNITRKELSGSLTGAVSKVYDGTNIAALLGTNLAGVVRGDDLVVSAASTIYEDRNVGTQKLVTVTGMTLAGEDAANYLLLQDNASAAVGMITPRIVSVTTSGRGAKTYDGTTDFVGQTGTLALATAQGDAATAALLAADGVALDTGLMTGVLADRNAGTGKSVDLTGFTLANNAFGNYALASDIVRGVADIARAQLTLSAVGDSKVYNGTTVSDGQVRMTGLVAGDMASATQAFDSWNAGNRSLKVVNYTVDDGNVGANYLVSTLDAGGVIAQRELILQVDNASKVAGAIDPTFTFTVGGAGLVAGDTVSGAATRDAGEAAGAYAIRQGSLSAGANYAMNVVPGRLTIDAATTTPDTGNGGTVPDTGNGGTVPDTGNGGTVPDTGNGGTVPDTGNGGTVPDTGNGGT